MAKIEQSTDIIPVIADTKDIKSLIYVVRGQQVMLDSDLAMLYQVETKVFNQAVSRNIERFPENFRFQLTKEEFEALRSQIVTSNGRGGCKTAIWKRVHGIDETRGIGFHCEIPCLKEKNDQYPICFCFEDGEASRVELVDYH